MQNFSRGPPGGPGWAPASEWSLGRRVSREVTCVRGLSKHPGSVHGDVAFTTRADLTEFNCAGRHPSLEAEGLCPPSSLPFFQIHCTELTLRIWDPWGPYLSPQLGRGHRHPPSWHPGCSSTRPGWCSGPEGWSRAAGRSAQRSIPCGWGLGRGPLAGPQEYSDLRVIDALYHCLSLALWGTLAFEFIFMVLCLYSTSQCTACFYLYCLTRCS